MAHRFITTGPPGWSLAAPRYDPRKSPSYNFPVTGRGNGRRRRASSTARLARERQAEMMSAYGGGTAGYVNPYLGMQLGQAVTRGKRQHTADLDKLGTEIENVRNISGMSSEEANLLYQKQADIIQRGYAQAAPRALRNLPAGAGATRELGRQLADEALTKKLESQRDIDIEKLASGREAERYKSEALTTGLSELAQLKREFDVYDMQDAGALLETVIAGGLSPQELQVIMSVMQGMGMGGGGAAGYGSGGGYGRRYT